MYFTFLPFNCIYSVTLFFKYNKIIFKKNKLPKIRWWSSEFDIIYTNSLSCFVSLVAPPNYEFISTELRLREKRYIIHSLGSLDVPVCTSHKWKRQDENRKNGTFGTKLPTCFQVFWLNFSTFLSYIKHYGRHCFFSILWKLSLESRDYSSSHSMHLISN